MKDEFKINLDNLRETEKLAQKIAKRLKPKSFISLRGKLGVGKTTLVSFIINNLSKKKKDLQNNNKDYFYPKISPEDGLINFSESMDFLCNFIRSKTEKEKKSKKLLPAYFCSFGVESALDRFIKNKKNAEKRIKNKF